MSFAPVRPAVVDFGDPAVPRSPEFDDVYHARAGAIEQAQHVFLAGNGLPTRWKGRTRFVVLETGFGLGNNFLATWAAWRADPQRSERLVFVSIEAHPLRRDDLARAHAGSPLGELADQLLAAWPALTPDLHVLDFEQGRVRLMLVFADVAVALSELSASVDAFFLDGFAPSKNPHMWAPHTLRRLPRLAAAGATAATWSVAAEVREGLAAAGFVVEKAPGFGGKREMTVARFAPRFASAPPPGRQACDATEVAVIGARLAGSGVARALAREGLAVEVLEARPAATLQPSAEFGGLFHGIVHRQDGTHARWLRAAALHAQRAMAPAIAEGRVPGAMGLLRGEHAMSLAQMHELIEQQALPPDWVQALDAPDASALSGVRIANGAWYYPGGGWAAPMTLVHQWLQHPRIRVRADTTVASLAHDGQRWLLHDRDGGLITAAPVVVLANASDAMRVLGQPAWPWEQTRGQVSVLPAGLPPLRAALADGGYALQLPDGRVLCGATMQPGDLDPNARPADDLENLATLRRLTGWDLPDSAAAQAQGRVGWRMQVGDRLPLLGAVPTEPVAGTPRADQARFIHRQPGLYLAAGFGSRGMTHAALAGEVLAAWITGAPMPVPSSLLDAVDPARFAVRLSRKSAT